MLESELLDWRDRLQYLPIAVCVCDSHWNIVFLNRQATAYFQPSHDGLETGSSLLDLWPPETRSELRVQLEARNENPSRLILPSPDPRLPGETIEATVERFQSGGEFYCQIAFQALGVQRSQEKAMQIDEEHAPFRLLDRIHDAVFLWRFEDRTIQFWNTAAEHLYEYSAEDARGQPVSDLLATRQIGGMPEMFRDLEAEGRWSGQLNQRTRSGKELDVMATMTTLKVGSDLMVIEMNHDLSERRAAEKALRFHFDLNKNITDQAVDPIFVIGARGDIIFANREAERVFGWTAEQLIGKSLHVMLHHHAPDGNHLLREDCPLWLAQINGQVIRSLELVFFHKNGIPVHVSCSNSPLLFENQELGSVLIIQDITGRKNMERALAESEERLRLAVESSNIGAWDLSLLTGAVTLDGASRIALGLETDGEARVGSWLRSVHPEDRPLARDRMRAALDPTGNGQFVLECRTVSRHDQKLRYVQARGQAFFDENEGHRAPVRVVGTLQDVTDRKRDEEALRQANHDLQQFAYAAAHDLQEPLRNVVNLLGLYKRGFHNGGDGAGTGDLIDLTIGDARRMHQMIVDLLSFTDVQKDLEEPIQLVEAGAILTEVLLSLRNIIDEAGAAFVCEPLPAISIRPSHLSQLLQNIIMNALKYRRKDVPCSVRISARRRGTEWLFSVADNGIGFDNSYAQRIFGVFKRLHGQHDYPGSGIGLAICSRIVQLYSGRIWAEGEIGKGATFFFTLPAASHLRAD